MAGVAFLSSGCGSSAGAIPSERHESADMSESVYAVRVRAVCARQLSAEAGVAFICVPLYYRES